MPLSGCAVLWTFSLDNNYLIISQNSKYFSGTHSFITLIKRTHHSFVSCNIWAHKHRSTSMRYNSVVLFQFSIPYVIVQSNLSSPHVLLLTHRLCVVDSYVCDLSPYQILHVPLINRHQTKFIKIFSLRT